MNKIVKNYIYNVLYQIFLIVVPLITAPYLTRILSSSVLGVYDYINSVISVITTFGLMGLLSYGYRQIAYFRDNKDDVVVEFSSLFVLRVCLLVLVTVFYLPFSFNSEYKTYYIIQYALIVAQYLDISWVFIGFEDLRIVSLRNFLAKLITVIGIFVFIKDDSDLWVYFALFSFTTLLTTVSIYPLARKYVKLKKCSLKKVVSHIKPALKLFIPQVATLMYLQFGKIMLKFITHSTSQVAYYAYAEKIINIPLAVITALGTVMMPRLANLYTNKEKNKIAVYLKMTIEFAMFIAIPMAVGLATISDGFIPWYLGEEYLASSTAIVVLSPICVLNALSNILGAQYLTAVNKTKELTIAYYGAAFVNIILNAILIPLLGYLGAAIATILCSLASVAIQLLFVCKDISFKGIGKQLVKNVAASLTMFVVLSVLKKIFSISAAATLIEIVIGGATYVLVAALLKDEFLLFAYKRIIQKRKCL